MNAITAIRPLPATFAKPAANPNRLGASVLNAPTRHLHRDRDFGIGYGNSSGYASERRYTSDWGPSRFRCA